jgi:hypothetical protein
MRFAGEQNLLTLPAQPERSDSLAAFTASDKLLSDEAAPSGGKA